MKDLTYRVSKTTAHAYANATAAEPPSTPTAPTLTAAAAVGTERLAEWPSFVREAFGHLYRPADAATTLPTPPTWAQRATKALLDDPSMPELQAMCAGSRALAADSAARLAMGVAGVLGIDELPKDKDAATDERDARADVEALAELAEETGDERMVDSAKGAGRRWARAKARRDMLAGAAMGEQVPGAIGNVLARVKGEVAERAEAMGVLRGFGLSGAAGALGDDVPADLAAAVMRDKLLRDVLLMLGRIKQVQRGKVDTVPGAGNLDLVGVDLGDDIGALVDDELTAMCLGAGAEDDVLARASEKRAMVWSRRNEDKAGEGDFTILVDCSGSMAMWTRATVARAVSLAMVLDAVRAKRRVVLVTFASDVLDVVIVDKPTQIGAAMRALSRAPDGGTNATAAMEAAGDVNRSNGKRADAVIVTDGDWTAGASWVDQLLSDDGAFTEVRVVDKDSRQTPTDVMRAHPWMTAATVVRDVVGAVQALGLVAKAGR